MELITTTFYNLKFHVLQSSGNTFIKAYQDYLVYSAPDFQQISEGENLFILKRHENPAALFLPAYVVQ